MAHTERPELNNKLYPKENNANTDGGGPDTKPKVLPVMQA